MLPTNSQHLLINYQQKRSIGSAIHLAVTGPPYLPAWPEEFFRRKKMQRVSPYPCPNCGAPPENVRPHGRWILKDGESEQQWECHKCGHKFLKGEYIPSKNLGVSTIVLKATKNLAAFNETKSFFSAANQPQKGLLVEFAWDMKKRNLIDITIKNRTLAALSTN